MFNDEGIHIEDRLRSSLRERIEQLNKVDLFTTIHMGSSKYFVPSELEINGDGTVTVDIDQLEQCMTLNRVVPALNSPEKDDVPTVNHVLG